MNAFRQYLVMEEDPHLASLHLLECVLYSLKRYDPENEGRILLTEMFGMEWAESYAPEYLFQFCEKAVTALRAKSTLKDKAKKYRESMND